MWLEAPGGRVPRALVLKRHVRYFSDSGEAGCLLLVLSSIGSSSTWALPLFLTKSQINLGHSKSTY